MGQPDQGYYVERIQRKDTDKIAISTPQEN